MASPLEHDAISKLQTRRASSFVGLDALRGWAAVGVVVLHACVPYSDPSMPGLLWCVTDVPSEFATTLMWTIEVFIMPLFLVMAGFLAAKSLNHRHPRDFFRSRLSRLGWPLLLCTVFLIPLELYLWLGGWFAEGQISARKFASLKFSDEIDAQLWGLSHLWFLQYLISYVGLLAIAWPTAKRLSTMSLQRYALLACGITALIALGWEPEVAWGFQHSFVPLAGKWIYSGVFFAAGCCWFLIDPGFIRLSRVGWRLLIPGILFLAAAVTLGQWWLARLDDGVTVWHDLSLAVLTLLAASCVTFGLIGTFQQHVTHLNRTTACLANASMTIYLLHHPIVALSHFSMKFGLPEVPSALKVVAATLIAISMTCAIDWLYRSRKRRSQVSPQIRLHMPDSEQRDWHAADVPRRNAA